jgi:hypothetical protein
MHCAHRNFVHFHGKRVNSRVWCTNLSQLSGGVVMPDREDKKVGVHSARWCRTLIYLIGIFLVGYFLFSQSPSQTRHSDLDAIYILAGGVKKTKTGHYVMRLFFYFVALELNMFMFMPLSFVYPFSHTQVLLLLAISRLSTSTAWRPTTSRALKLR